MEKSCSQSYGSRGGCTKTNCFKRDQRVCWTAPASASMAFPVHHCHKSYSSSWLVAYRSDYTLKQHEQGATIDERPDHPRVLVEVWGLGSWVAEAVLMYSYTSISVPAYAVTNFFFLIPLLISAVPTECANITLIIYNEGHHDNYFCQRECGKLPGGRLAIPMNVAEYNCITMPIEGNLQYQTPVWTGIGVRPGGGLYNPRTNQTVPRIFRQDPLVYSDLTSYGTLLVGVGHGDPRNCVYLHNTFYVEARCSFLHLNFAPVQCACERGKQLLIPAYRE